MTSKQKLISIVVPVYNEELVLSAFYERLVAVLDNLDYDSEIIFIDDGSKDSSIVEMHRLAEIDSRVKYLSFSKNFGHQIALAAGLDYVTGDAIISLDADLQHPPELIPELIKHWEDGNDVVYTIRKKTDDATFFKNITSALFYKVMNVMSAVEIVPGASDYRLIGKNVCDALKSHQERERFYRGMIQWVGFKQQAVEFDAEARFAGQSSYSLRKMIRFALDGFLSYSYIPIYFVISLAIFVVMLACGYMLFALYIYLSGGAVVGQTSIIMSVLMMGGVQLLAVAINSFYVYKIYQEVKGRPLYIVREIRGLKQIV